MKQFVHSSIAVVVAFTPYFPMWPQSSGLPSASPTQAKLLHRRWKLLSRTCYVTQALLESVIWALRINEITGVEVFSSLDSTGDGLKTNAADFGIDLRLHPAEPSMTHKRDVAQFISVSKQSRVQADTKTRTDAVARAHGEQFCNATLRVDLTLRLDLYYRFKESMAQRCKTK